MIPKYILIYLLVIYGCENSFASYKQCSSCMLIHQCPEALNLLEDINISETLRKFRDASCGRELKDGKSFSKFCCSDFIDYRPATEEDENIEMHRNFALLPRTCGVTNEDRIIGSELVEPHTVPWMAVLAQGIGGKRHNFVCGGTVINPRYILTAAHCVKDKKIVGVRIGYANITDDCEGEYPHYTCENDVQDIPVEKSIIHEGYSVAPHIQNNIALLRLKKPIDFSTKNARPICLPIYDPLRKMDLSGKRATLTGRGFVNLVNASANLRKINIPIKTKFDCREYYNISTETNSGILDKTFCAGEEGKDSCLEGPLTLEEEYKGSFRVIQFGIGSYGPRKCGTAIPDVYTDVRKYVKWILDKIEE